MNLKQKILTTLALLAFLISALNVPWEVTTFEDSYSDPGAWKWREQGRSIVSRPIWAPPSLEYFPGRRTEARVLWVPVAGTWGAIGVVYAGLFVLLKSRSPKTTTPNTP